MIDCPNAEIRDRLPDLVHERLDAAARATVLAHVEACAACAAELALLRRLHVGLSRTSSLDVGVIARGVVARTVSAAGQPAGARRPVVPSRRWMDWRVAAAITVLAVGGASIATIRNGGPEGDAAETARATRVVEAPRANDSGRGGGAPAVTPEVVTATAELSMGGGVADLSDSDLRALLADIQALDAMPEPEPEPVTVRVSLPGSVP